MFDKMRIEDDGVRNWFRAVLASKTKDAQADTRVQRAEFQRRKTMITAAQQDRLLNLRIDDQIDDATFSRKRTETRDRFASIKLQLDVPDRSRDENAETTSKVFELSQTLRQRWLTADYSENVIRIATNSCAPFAAGDLRSPSVMFWSVNLAGG